MFKGLAKHGIMPIFGGAFKVLLLVVTAINTWGILYLVSNNYVWAAAALILFEVGLIYWWMVFKNDTDASVLQMAISLLMFIACLLLVAAANALHLGAVQPDMLGEGTIPKVVIVAVVLHLGASLVYPLVSTEHLSTLMEQILLGLVWAKAQANVFGNIDRLAARTQTALEERMWSTIELRINNAANDRLVGAPVDNQPALPPPAAEPQPVPAPAAESTPEPSPNGSGPGAH